MNGHTNNKFPKNIIIKIILLLLLLLLLTAIGLSPGGSGYFTCILNMKFGTYLLTYLFTYSFTYLLTYLLTPWCRVLLEKLTGLQLVKKFSAFHGTRRFITALTTVRQLSLSWATPIQSIYPHPTSWRSILILPTHLRLGLPSGLLPSGFPTKTLYTPSPLLTHTRHMPSPSHSSRFYHLYNIW